MTLSITSRTEFCFVDFANRRDRTFSLPKQASTPRHSKGSPGTSIEPELYRQYCIYLFLNTNNDEQTGVHRRVSLFKRGTHPRERRDRAHLRLASHHGHRCCGFVSGSFGRGKWHLRFLCERGMGIYDRGCEWEDAGAHACRRVPVVPGEGCSAGRMLSTYHMMCAHRREHPVRESCVRIL